MDNIACSLIFDDKWFSSGIISGFDKRVVLTILPKHLYLSTSKSIVWFRKENFNDEDSIVESPAFITKTLTLPRNLFNDKIESIFVILNLTYRFEVSNDYKPLSYNRLYDNPILPGDNILVVGSPFGPMCPPVLLNNHFGGIVSKTCGPNVEMLLIDTFCPPGMIGAPVFILKKDTIFLYGLLISDYRSSNTISSNNFGTIFPVLSLMEIAIQFHCNIRNSFSLLKFLLLFSYDIPLIIPTNFSSICSIIFPHIYDKLVSVSARNNFGNGYLLPNDSCITCSHVIADMKIGDSVYVSSYTNSNVIYKIVFSTSPNVYPDIAILAKSPGLNYGAVSDKEFDVINRFPKLSKGLTTFGVSYGVSAYTGGSQMPSFSFGCISNVVKVNNLVLFGQATCCLNPGSSGGLLIDRNSLNAIGLFFGFAKSINNDMLDIYPQLGRFIPFETIQHILNTGIVDICEKFESDKNIQGLWNYKGTIGYPSKL